MAKRIAVLLRNRQDEGLRMAVGLTLADDRIDVYVLDRLLEETDSNTLNLETLELMEMRIYTNCDRNKGIAFVSTSEIAGRLLEYDSVLPY